MAWTDERMDDLANRMDAGFERVDNDIRELRAEIRTTREDLRVEIRTTRAELKGDIVELRTELKGDIAELRATMTRFGIALIVAMVGMIATLMGVIATGALGA